MNNGKYKPEIVEEILKRVRIGVPNKWAALGGGISEETFYQWINPTSPVFHPEFLESLNKAEAEAVARNVAMIQKASEKTWTAAAWWLERKHAKHFALKQEVQHSGEIALPILMGSARGGQLVPGDDSDQESQALIEADTSSTRGDSSEQDDLNLTDPD